MGFRDNLSRKFKEASLPAELTIFEKTDSTNTRAKEYARARAGGNPAFFVASEQSGGRGRLGKSFLSERGGLYLSYLSYPDMPPSEAILLTVYSAVLLTDILSSKYGLSPGIKWVNDVYIGEKKLAGILTEGEFSDDLRRFKYAVVGIGVNVGRVDFPDELSDIATDLSREGCVADIADIAIELMRGLLEFSPDKKSEYIKKYREYSMLIGRRVKVLAPTGDYLAEAVGIDDDAALVVKNDNNERLRLTTGDVSIKIGGF